MIRINLGSVLEWDDLELVSAEAGKVFSMNSPTDDDWANYRRLNDCVPSIERVEVVALGDGFTVGLGPDEVINQLSLGSLYRKIKYLHWRTSNIARRFDPLLAAGVARRYGVNRLRYRNSWLKVTIPVKLHVEARQQTRPETVGYLIAALGAPRTVMDMATFWDLSARSIAKPMRRGEAEQYLEAMGVRTNALDA